MRLWAGPLAVILLLTGCLGAAETPAEAPAPDVRTDAASLRPLTASFSGKATGTPASAGAYEFPFDVPSGAVGVNGTLTWDSPAARFRLELVDPRGDVVATGYRDASGALVVVTVDPPRPGTWTFRVLATLAVEVPFQLDAVAELLVPEDNIDRETLTLGPASFYEVNLILEEGASFRFSFNSSEPVKWDVHSHPPGGVKYWQQGEGTTAAGEFTAPARGVYSVLWENTASIENELSFEIVGRFRIHSHGG